ncbi:glycoside hydrolase family 43 C-terminal domain-containing protein [Exiguobacterium sp. s146]|uniref:lipocalin-like domain-containing protein n=1 Tax=Exiguobacterium sp. s146 TaxID=2751223 RepID=UPI0020368ABC|nr:glycoside hydrolase family 43 C-terminal domain-containing protein [Exiguobacterium sp. s146]
MVGDWEVITFPRFDDGKQESSALTLERGGKLGSGDGSWRLNGSVLKVEVGQETYETQVGAAWDWENWQPTIIFTGLSQDGTAIWGKKQ